MKTKLDYMRHTQKWRGKYRGIEFDVCRSWSGKTSEASDRPAFYSFEPHWVWTFYIHLHEAQIPDGMMDSFNAPVIQSENGSFYYDYSNAEFLHDLPWHGGLTFYSKDGGADGTPVWIKIGCDYNHEWDAERGYVYTVEEVTTHAERVIDALWERVPSLRVRCTRTGKFIEPTAETEAAI